MIGCKYCNVWPAYSGLTALYIAREDEERNNNKMNVRLLVWLSPVGAFDVSFISGYFVVFAWYVDNKNSF